MPIDIPTTLREAYDLIEQAKRAGRCEKEVADLEKEIENYRLDAPFYWQEIAAIGVAVILDIIATVLGTPLIGLLVFAGTALLIWIYTREHRELRELRAGVVRMRSDLLRKCLGT